jgi:hypothetical protein
LDFKDCIGNPRKEQVKIPTFNYNVNKDNSNEETILALNTNEQMFKLNEPEKENYVGNFLFV